MPEYVSVNGNWVPKEKAQATTEKVNIDSEKTNMVKQDEKKPKPTVVSGRKPMSEEHKQKIREAQRKRHAKAKEEKE